VAVTSLLNEEYGANEVLWESGGGLTARAIRAGVIQKVVGFVAPKLVGGSGGYSPVGSMGIERMSDALELEDVTVAMHGRDVAITGYLSDARMKEKYSE